MGSVLAPAVHTAARQADAQAAAEAAAKAAADAAATAATEAAANAAANAAAEARRLAALHGLAVLDTLPDPVFDAITAAAAQVCGAPIALVSLLDDERQWFKSNIGLPGVTETPRSVAFCDHAIRGTQVLEVADARLDPRFAANPLVTGNPHIRFYAGAPIVLDGGARMGTVCVIDQQPRQLSDQQRATLHSLGRIAAATLQAAGQFAALGSALGASESRYRAIVEDQTELISLAGRDRRLRFVNGAYALHFGLLPAQMVGHDLLDFVDAADRAAVVAHWDAVCAQHEAVSAVNRMRSAQGQTRWVAWTNRPLLDAQGQVVAMQSVGRDITSQHLAEQALAQHEQRQRRLYESTPALLHSVDAQGRLINVSDNWLQLLGYEREEVIGRRSTEFLTPASAQRAREQVLPAFVLSGRCDAVPYQIVRKDGAVLDIELSAVLERDAAGAPLRSLAVLQDVTASKRMATELRVTHERLDAIVDNVPALLGHWDAGGITRFANREFQAAIGLPHEQIIGSPLQAVCAAVDPLAYEMLAPHVAAVLQGGRQEFELPMLTTTGLRQLRMTLVPDQPRAGTVAGFYALAHDITGRKALELRLSDSELRYRSLFDNLNSGFALHEVVVDATGQPVDYRFLAVNDAFATVTGLTPAQTVGRLVTEVVPGLQHDPANWIGVLGRVALTGEPVHLERRAQALDQWFDVAAYRPAPGQFAVIVHNVTARKQAEVRLQQALKEKETLLKEVYHRVKNNLQVVQSLLNLQRRSVPDGVARGALDDSVQRVRAMALVHEKLYQSGDLSAVSLADYTQDLLKQIADATGAAQRRITLRCEVPPLQIGLDNAIPFGLLTAELVGNALKHGFPGGAGGQVLVALVPQDEGVLLSVCDDGAGLPRGFDLTGVRSMGLQLAASLARQIGGELQATSARGTTFSAHLKRL